MCVYFILLYTSYLVDAYMWVDIPFFLNNVNDVYWPFKNINKEIVYIHTQRTNYWKVLGLTKKGYPPKATHKHTLQKQA